MRAVLGGGDSVVLAGHSRVDHITANATPTASVRTFWSTVRSVESMADAEASLHNSMPQPDSDSVPRTAESGRAPFRIAPWERSETPPPAPTDLEADKCAGEPVPAGSPAQGTSSARQDISQLPTTDDIKETASTTRLAKKRLATANGMCSIDRT